jgi:hypothetical protein
MRQPRESDRLGEEVEGGLLSTVGSALRAPGGLLKLASLGAVAAGLGLGLGGGLKALASARVVVERGAGVTCEWKVLGRPMRTRHFAVAEIGRVSLSQETFRLGRVRTGDEVGRPRDPITPRWRLVLELRSGGRALIEAFLDEATAEQRRHQVEALLSQAA